MLTEHSCLSLAIGNSRILKTVHNDIVHIVILSMYLPFSLSTMFLSRRSVKCRLVALITVGAFLAQLSSAESSVDSTG